MSKKVIQLLSPAGFKSIVTASQQRATRVVPVDGSWYMPNSPRDPAKEFEKLRLPGAKFFDIDATSNTSSPYPHMLPSVDQWNSAIQNMGITQDDIIVVYDTTGTFSAPRVAWTFQIFGHDNVYVLDHFPAYQKAGLPVQTSMDAAAEKNEPSSYKSRGFDAEAALSFEQIVEIVSDEKKRSQYAILDARPTGRFTGETSEPRPHLPSGHAPGAKSLPYAQVLKDDGTFEEPDALKKIFAGVGITTPDQPTIVMCGSGVTACILKAALDRVGYNKGGIQVYDGSWTEYAQRAGPELIVKGFE